MLLLTAPRGTPPPLRRLIIPFLFVTALFVTLYMRRVEPDFLTTEIRGQAMGTSYLIKVVSPAETPASYQALSDGVQAAIGQVNRSMSTYLADSEISQLNGHGANSPFDASSDLRAVLAKALAISEETRGAFDPTIGPVVNAWGFGPDKASEPPSEGALNAARARVGYKKIRIDETTGRITKSQADVYVDLSAIAKGYAVDQVAKTLSEAGQRDFLVEIGGELRTSGLNHRRKPWRLAVERPGAGMGEVHKNAIIDLGTGAMATSGDYRNFYEVDGKRVSHTIDPRTGRPITHSLSSVTVVAETCMEADGWATALNVLGPDEAMALAEKNGLKIFMLIRGKDGYQERATEGFTALRSILKQPE
ncbi:MAG: FAD:protein FMN transferase [Myxococcota bacterium]|nr:FAD:protein FMN transferase [Myxococcota bacterium]